MNNELLSILYELGTARGAGNNLMNKIDMASGLMKLIVKRCCVGSVWGTGHTVGIVGSYARRKGIGQIAGGP